MKQLQTTLILLLGCMATTQAQVGIGTNTPHPSAQLEVASNNKGLLTPRLTTAERIGIAAPAKGLMVFDNDTNSFWYYTGTIWQNMTTAVAGGSGWALTGNIGINAGNFLGSTDSQHVVIKTKNLDRINIGANDVITLGNGKDILLNISGTSSLIGGNNPLLPATGGPFGTLGATIGGVYALSHTEPNNLLGSDNYYLRMDGKTIQSTSSNRTRIEKAANLFLNPFGGNVVVGSTDNLQESRARLVVNASPTVITNAIFGNNGNGISLQKNFPTIGFNSYRDFANVQRYMGAGYAFGNAVDPNTGMCFWNAMGKGAANDQVGGNEQYVMGLSQEGNLGIGTLPNTNFRLSINGSTRSKEIVVETGWADFVFDKKYKLPTLLEVETYIKANNHLPEIPSAQEIQTNGLKVGQMQTKMMQKIEELTLYVIELKKEIELLKKKNILR
jgi:hypothetical protein